MFLACPRHGCTASHAAPPTVAAPTAVPRIPPRTRLRGTVACSRFVVLLAAAGVPPAAVAQTPEHNGLTASIAASRTVLMLADRASLKRDAAMSVTLGYRIRLWCWSRVNPDGCWVRRRGISVTPHLAFTATHLGGIDEGSTDVAFSHLDQGVQVAARVGRARPFAVARRGRGTIERTNANAGAPFPGVPRAHAVNYRGDGTAWGGGVEIPLRRADRGLTVSVTRLSGEFAKAETRDRTFDTSLRYRATVLAVGWGGRLRGTSLPWR